MLRNTFRLFSVAGIEVGIHVSWLAIFALLTFSLATGFFPQAVPSLSPLEAWGLAAVAAILFFGSVLIHELAHSFTARARGLDARSITLFIFGGVSNLGGEAKQPSVEFVVAIVGPLSSFAIAGVSYVLARILPGEALQALFGYLAVVNALVGGFNLIPGYPLDGGRVLRSIAWRATNSVRRGTDIAAGAGQLIGGLFILWGVIQIFGGETLGGLWIAAIGWFLQNAAQAGQQQVILEQRLQNVRVATVLRPDPTAVSPDATVAEVIERYLLPGNRRAVPVVDEGKLVGIVTLGDIGKVPVEERATARVGQVMGGRDGLVTVKPNDTLSHAFQALGERDLEQVPVVEDGRLIGMLTRADLMRQLQLREALDVEVAPA
jgi:Zn-dependent protease/CBS domain-containing protein